MSLSAAPANPPSATVIDPSDESDIVDIESETVLEAPPSTPHKQRKLEENQTPKSNHDNSYALNRLLIPTPSESFRKRKAEARLKKMLLKNELETTSDEERSYTKSIRERTYYAEVERRDAILMRMKYEQTLQDRTNHKSSGNSRKFIDGKTKSNLEGAKYQQLVSVDLWSPPSEFKKPAGISLERITSESLNLPQIIEYPTYKHAVPRHAVCNLEKLGLPPKTPNENLSTPEFRTVEDCDEGWNSQITTDYNTDYKKGYIVSYMTPEPSQVLKTPLKNAILQNRALKNGQKLLKSPNRLLKTPGPHGNGLGINNNKKVLALTNKSRSAPPKLHTRFYRIPRQSLEFIHPTRFTPLELAFASSAYKLFGCDWLKMSQLFFQIKSPLSLQSSFKRSKQNFMNLTPVAIHNIQCNVCLFKILNPSQMVFCDCCDRAYHLTCTIPMLDAVPSTDWYCSAQCLMLAQLKCYVCGLETNDDELLICDGCQAGVHAFCLSKPLVDIPDGDWFCDRCAAAEGITKTNIANGILTYQKPKVTEVENMMPKQLESTAMITIANSSKCKHKQFFKAPTSKSKSSNQKSSSSNASTKLDLKSSSSSNTRIGHESSGTFNFSKFVYSSDLSPHQQDPYVQLLLSHSIDVLWKNIAAFNDLCIDCITEADEGIIPGNSLFRFGVGHVLTPSNDLSQSIFAAQIDDIPSTGPLPNEDTLKTHFSRLAEATAMWLDLSALNPILSHGPIGQTHRNQKVHTRDFSLHSQHLTTYTKITPQQWISMTRNVIVEPPPPGFAGGHGSNNALARVIPSGISPIINLPTDPRRGRKSSPSSTPGESTSKSNGRWYAEAGYSLGERCYWIFQANPAIFDITSALLRLTSLTWVVRQNVNKVKLGDKVFIWESGKDAGIVALATVSSNPTMMKESPAMKEFFADSSKFDTAELRCGLEVKRIKRYLKSQIVANHHLKDLTILRAPIGTNFRVSKLEGETLHSLIQNQSHYNEFPTLRTARNNQRNSSTSHGGNTKIITQAKPVVHPPIGDASSIQSTSSSTSSASSTASSSSASTILVAPIVEPVVPPNTKVIEKEVEELTEMEDVDSIEPIANDFIKSNLQEDGYDSNLDDSSGSSDEETDRVTPTGSMMKMDASSAMDISRTLESSSSTSTAMDITQLPTTIITATAPTASINLQHLTPTSVSKQEPFETKMEGIVQISSSTMLLPSSIASTSIPLITPPTSTTTQKLTQPLKLLRVPSEDLNLVIPISIFGNLKHLNTSLTSPPSASQSQTLKKSQKNAPLPNGATKTRIPILSIPHIAPILRNFKGEREKRATNRQTRNQLQVQQQGKCPACNTAVVSLSASASISCSLCGISYHVKCAKDTKKKVKDWRCAACAQLDSAACKVCGLNDNDEHQTTLLCDSCDNAFHLHCLNPPLSEVPDDHWFCGRCNIPPEQIAKLKLLFVLRELRLETIRLIQSRIDIISFEMKQCLDNQLDPLSVLLRHQPNLDSAFQVIPAAAENVWYSFRSKLK